MMCRAVPLKRKIFTKRKKFRGDQVIEKRDKEACPEGTSPFIPSAVDEPGNSGGKFPALPLR
jgi:hypothetical protein